jgi:protein O-GlcNAc transferase
MPTHAELLSVAFEHLQTGNDSRAEQICREVIATQPGNADAWHLLGLIYSHRGDHSKAGRHLAHASQLNPADVEIHNNLGIALLQLGRFIEAADCHRAALAIDPQSAVGHFNLALALQSQGSRQEAIHSYLRAIAIDPNLLATHCNLGNLLKDEGQIAAAIECYQRVLAIDSSSATTHYNLGLVLNEQGISQAAITCFRTALGIEPNFLEAHLCLGNLLYEIGHDLPAIHAYQQALALDPHHAGALHNLAIVFLSQSRLVEADACLAKLLKTNLQSADALALLARLQQMRAQPAAAIEALQQAYALQPSPRLHSKLLMASQYAAEPTAAQLLVAHRHWDAVHARSLLPATLRLERKTGPLRIGFVSKDFRRHPIGFLALPLLEALDKSACSITCYSDNLFADEFTARFRAASNTWHVVPHLTDEALAQQIRSDQIDILIDLMGHSGDRLLTFARKPAPVQITWLGYVGTTGLAAMDFLLADSFHIRPGEESNYAETVLRLPNCYACYAPPPESPPVGPLPSLGNQPFTFGCFNNPAKYSPAMFDAWAAILQRLPNSRLFLKYGGLDDPTLQSQLRQEFQTRGIYPVRLLLEGWSPSREFLAAYNRVDLALDTQPYSGGLTTCEALHMGVPTITFPSQTFAGRHATSYLANIGLTNFIAADLSSYIDLALDWATRPADLAPLRLELRHRLHQSPIGNAPQFARDFLHLLNTAHQSKLAR